MLGCEHKLVLSVGKDTPILILPVASDIPPLPDAVKFTDI